MNGIANMTVRGCWVTPYVDTARFGLVGVRLDWLSIVGAFQAVADCAKSMVHADHRRRRLLVTFPDVCPGSIEMTVHRSVTGLAFELGAESLRFGDSSVFVVLHAVADLIRRAFPAGRLSLHRLDWSVQLRRVSPRTLAELGRRLPPVFWGQGPYGSCEQHSNSRPGFSGTTLVWEAARQFREGSVCAKDSWRAIVYDAVDVDGTAYTRAEVRERIARRQAPRRGEPYALTENSWQFLAAVLAAEGVSPGKVINVEVPARFASEGRSSVMSRRVGIGCLLRGVSDHGLDQAAEAMLDSGVCVEDDREWLGRAVLDEKARRGVGPSAVRLFVDKRARQEAAAAVFADLPEPDIRRA